MSSDSDFLNRLWIRLVDDDFSADKLVARIRHDGGYDIESLSNEVMLALIAGTYDGAWDGVAFSFSELLAYYSVPGGMESAEQIIGWVFAALMIARCVRHAATDWEMEFDKFINGYVAARQRLETEESIEIFERVWGGPRG
jgi:hypothetical protein